MPSGVLVPLFFEVDSPMGAFDSELYALGYRSSGTKSNEELGEEVKPEVGKQYRTWFKCKLVKVEILSLHSQIGVFKLLEPVRKQYDIGYVEEASFVIRTQTFYSIEG